MALIPSLGTALSGMKTAQSQLSIISSNVANVDTEGYTRKIAQQKNVILAGYSQGVSIGEVTRKVNEGLLKSYLAANSLRQPRCAKQLPEQNRNPAGNAGRRKLGFRQCSSLANGV